MVVLSVIERFVGKKLPSAWLSSCSSLKVRLDRWIRAGGAWHDGCLIGLVLAVLNVWLAGQDPGWMNVNPTPWLLVPLFLGARYGVKPGIVAALGVTVAVLIWQSSEFDQGYPSLFAQHAYYFLALLGVGLVGGTGYFLVAGRAAEIEMNHEAQSARVRRLHGSLELLQQEHIKMKRVILMRDSLFSSLPEELGRLFREGSSRIDSGFLDLIRFQFGVRSAAIYRRTINEHGNDRFEMTTSEGDDFANVLLPDSAEGVIAAALRSGQLVSCRHLWKSAKGVPDNLLVAIPWFASEDSQPKLPDALLVIRRMDFEQIDWENFARLDALWNWVSCHHCDPGNQKSLDQQEDILTESAFQRRLDLAKQMHEGLFLEFRIVAFSLSTNSDQEVERLKRRAQSRLNPGDVMAVVGTELRVLISVEDDYAAASWLEVDGDGVKVEVRSLEFIG